MYLGTRAGQVGPEHNCPRSLVRELLAASLEAILEELDVATAAVAAVLVLDLVLDDERLLRKVDGGLERRGDGVVGGLGLRDEALVAVDDGLRGLLDGPLADVAVDLVADGRLLGGLGDGPPR